MGTSFGGRINPKKVPHPAAPFPATPRWHPRATPLWHPTALSAPTSRPLQRPIFATVSVEGTTHPSTPRCADGNPPRPASRHAGAHNVLPRSRYPEHRFRRRDGGSRTALALGIAMRQRARAHLPVARRATPPCSASASSTVISWPVAQAAGDPRRHRAGRGWSPCPDRSVHASWGRTRVSSRSTLYKMAGQEAARAKQRILGHRRSRRRRGILSGGTVQHGSVAMFRSTGARRTSPAEREDG